MGVPTANNCYTYVKSDSFPVLNKHNMIFFKLRKIGLLDKNIKKKKSKNNLQVD